MVYFFICQIKYKDKFEKFLSKYFNFDEIDEYIKKVKQSNENYDTKIENIRLNNSIVNQIKKNRKVLDSIISRNILNRSIFFVFFTSSFGGLKVDNRFIKFSK